MSRAKQTEKGAPLEDAAKANVSWTMADIAAPLIKHKEELATEFKSSFESMTQRLNHITSAIGDHSVRIISLENATVTHQRLMELDAKHHTRQKESDLLKERVAELEGRSRRQNIQIVGLPEMFGGPGLTAFFSELQVEIFGEGMFSSPPEIDRAHRTLTANPTQGEKPRPVLLCFHRYQVKDLVIREAHKRKHLVYKGHPI
uniref:Uncharacterized protein n=1 Tax=Iconisemion striatum TaxID=60296 RepID=A0A1A7XA95_9TELE